MEEIIINNQEEDGKYQQQKPSDCDMMESTPKKTYDPEYPPNCHKPTKATFDQVVLLFFGQNPFN